MPAGRSISKVVLMAPGSTTHHSDMAQRYVDLPIASQGAGAVTFFPPFNSCVAPNPFNFCAPPGHDDGPGRSFERRFRDDLTPAAPAGAPCRGVPQGAGKFAEQIARGAGGSRESWWTRHRAGSDPPERPTSPPSAMNTTLVLILLCALFTASTAHASSLDLTADQKRLLNDAVYYLKDVDREAPKLTKLAEGLKNGTAPMAEHEIQNALAQVDYGGQKLNNSISRLNQLPANEPEVAAVWKRVQERAQELLAAQTTFQNAHKKDQEAVAGLDPNALRADVDKLRGLSSKLTDARHFLPKPDLGIETLAELPKMIEYRNECEKKYAAVLGLHEGRTMANTISGFDYQQNSFREQLPQIATLLINQAKSSLENANSIAEKAVERRSAAQFVNGVIDATMERAENEIGLMETIGTQATEATALRKELDETRKRLDATGKNLAKEILDGNTPPNDLYNGGDKQEFLDAVTKAWNKNHAKAEVLGMRVPMRAWERRTGWKWALDQFQKHDFSELQVAITIKFDAEIAHTYYAYLKRDHMAGDKLTVKLDDRGEVPLYRQLLLSNWK
ncbi:MAG: hypothetical protein GY711_35800 [bacterium]|nr:hypothetical protein [bacterium]